MKKVLGFIVIILVALCIIGNSGGDSDNTPSNENENTKIENSSKEKVETEEIKKEKSISEDSYWLYKMQYVYNYIDEYDIETLKFKERDKIANTLTESNYNDQWENIVYATEDPSFASGTCYISLGEEEKGEYIYWGELDRDGYPNGIGMVYECIDDIYYENPRYLIKYMGEFKDGYCDGYGVEFKIPDLYNEYTVHVTTEMFDDNIEFFNEPIYEGYFEKGVYTGKGMEIVSTYGGVDVNSGEVALDPNEVDYCLFIGNYMNGVIHGDGTIYTNGVIEYEGEFKHGNMIE